jgi:hypothetical protein
MSEPPHPPRLLVVAYRTLGGLQLLDEVADRVTQGRREVHVLVPVADDDGSARQRAAEALQVQLERLAAIGDRRGRRRRADRGVPSASRERRSA